MSFFQKRVTVDGGGFGQDLRDLRNVRGLSEQELSKISGIHPAMIQTLEQERLKDLQDPYYAERLVRALAIALDVRPDFLLSKYRRALEIHGIACEQANALRPTTRKRDFFVTSRLLIGAGIFGVVVCISAYMTWQVRQISAPPTLELAEPVEGFRATQPRVQVKGMTEPAAFVTVNGQQIVVQSDGSFKIDMSVPSGLSTVHVESRRRYGVSTVIERRVLFEREQSAFLQE